MYTTHTNLDICSGKAKPKTGFELHNFSNKLNHGSDLVAWFGDSEEAPLVTCLTG